MPRGISDKKLMAISEEIGPNDVMRLSLQLELSAAEANNLNLDCYRILSKAMKATLLQNQVTKLRGALLASGYTVVANKHLPGDKGKKPKKEVKSNPERKRKEDPPTLDATPKRPKAKSNLDEMKNNLKDAQGQLKEMHKREQEIQKKDQEIKKDIDKQNKEISKIKSAVAKLLEQKIKDDEKKLAKQLKDLDELKSHENPPQNTPGTSNTGT